MVLALACSSTVVVLLLQAVTAADCRHDASTFSVATFC